MGNRLKLRKNMVISKLDYLTAELFDSDNIRCDWDDELSISTAGTYRDNMGYAKSVTIGMREILNASGTGFHKNNPKISDDVFANVVLNMYHEKEHCIQKNELFRKEILDEFEQRQLISEIACIENGEYYKGDGNYTKNINEMEAERKGIESAYEYLSKEFPWLDKTDNNGVNKLESILVNVVNEKKTQTYFLEDFPDFKRVDEIYAAFDKAEKDSYIDSDNSQNRKYVVTVTNPKDPVKKYMKEHPEAQKVYLSLTDPLEKDRCVAAINLKLHPEWFEVYPVLKHMDLSYENVIVKPYKEMKERKEHELNAKKEEMNKVVKGEVESVKVPEKKKHYDEKDLEGLSRVEKAEMMFGHLMEDSEQKSEYEKE